MDHTQVVQAQVCDIRPETFLVKAVRSLLSLDPKEYHLKKDKCLENAGYVKVREALWHC